MYTAKKNIEFSDVLNVIYLHYPVVSTNFCLKRDMQVLDMIQNLQATLVLYMNSKKISA